MDKKNELILSILKKKRVDLHIFSWEPKSTCKNYNTFIKLYYNYKSEDFAKKLLTEQEFKLIHEWINNTTEENDMKPEKEHSLTSEEIKDVLCTALEGGIGYWACLLNDDPDWVAARNKLKKEKGEAPCYDEVAYEVLLTGHTIRFEDAEEDDIYELKWEDLMEGLRMFEEEREESVHTLLEDGEFDADDADCVIQLAIFKDIIFG